MLGAGAGKTALLGGLSALETVGFRGFLSDDVHVLLPARMRSDVPPLHVVPHRTSGVPDCDIHHLGDPPGTTPARSLVDAAQWARSEQTARAIVAAGFQQRLIRAADIRPVLSRMRRAHRRALVADMIGYATVGAESPAEADFLRLCRREHFPEPSLQHPRHDVQGRQR
ncbi:hypothetical protein ACWKSP_18570 [Micromonosporaceae bacterium Da 78-11]